MLPRTNKRERNKKGVIYMCWTHVWMRDGILPLNRECLKTSTVKTQVSQEGQAVFLFSSEKLLLAPQANTTHFASSAEWILIALCCLMTPGTTERSPSGCLRIPCKQRMPTAAARWPWSSGPLSPPAPSVRSRAGDTSGIEEYGGGHFPSLLPHSPSPTNACREMLMKQGEQQGWGRPAWGMPCPATQLLTAVCRDTCQLALSYLTWLGQPQMPSASKHVPWCIPQWAHVG